MLSIRRFRPLSRRLVDRIRRGYSVDLGEEREADSRVADVDVANAEREADSRVAKVEVASASLSDRPVRRAQAACDNFGHCPTVAATVPIERSD